MPSATRRKIDQVLASARKDLQAQLDALRAEQARLAAEEEELTAAIANLKANGDAPSAGKRQRAASGRKTAPRKRTAASSDGGRRRGRGSSGKSTAERVEELRKLLAEGPKSRADIAASLKVSPARVQQLLGELGSSVTSQPGADRRSKQWTIKGARDGGSTKPARGRPKKSSGSNAPRPRASTIK